MRALAALLLLGAAPAPADLLIRGGTVVTGTAPPFTGDVAVRGDRIVAVGPRLTLTAARVIDAKGMVVAPGFIDPHTHVDAELKSDDARRRLVERFLMQGVTTAFIGNDGYGPLDTAALMSSAKAKPVGINYAAYVGFGSVRKAVLGEADRAPDAGEMVRMKALVARAMCGGAMGLSTGLFYAPQSFSKTDEVAALAAEAGRYGGTYDSHIRDESSYTIGLKGAIREALTIGREGRLPVHISHIKALGVDVQGQAPQVIAMVETAQRSGQKVTADQYPWTASGTSLVAALMPPWAQDGGRAAMLKRFDDPATLARIRVEAEENLRKRGGADKLFITKGPGDTSGKTLARIAGERDAIDAAIEVIRREDPAVASFNQSEADIEAFMRRPWVMTGSDASTGHPRSWGSFARKYAVYVRERKVIDLPAFVARSSTLTADTFALKGRGRIAKGAYADLVVFDPATYAARGTYEKPDQPAIGMRTVVVNGRVAVDGGRLTGVTAGRALPHEPTRRCPA